VSGNVRRKERLREIVEYMLLLVVVNAMELWMAGVL
jgi:hypothetical protein